VTKHDWFAVVLVLGELVGLVFSVRPRRRKK
jgi:hypothetical protein